MIGKAFSSWNPNKYHQLVELTVWKVIRLALITALLCTVAFLVLLVPAMFQADTLVEEVGKTTSITLDASLEQTAPTYVIRNPDILLTTGEGDGFIVITPTAVSVKRFLFFGKQTYTWDSLGSLSTWPGNDLFVPVVLFSLPSLVFWIALFLATTSLVFAFLYTLISYFVLHARGFHITYGSLWKVSVYAGLPSMMVFAGLPVLRLGLPIAIIFGFLFVLWLCLAMLGTALFAEKHVPKGGGGAMAGGHGHTASKARARE